MSGPASQGVSQGNVSPEHLSPPLLNRQQLSPDHSHAPQSSPEHVNPPLLKPQQGSPEQAGQQPPSDPAKASSSDPFSQRVRQRFGRGAGHYEQEARLQQAMAWRLAHLCADLPLITGPRADLGAGTGLLSRALQRHHPVLQHQPPLQLDLCPELLARNPLAGPCAAADLLGSGYGAGHADTADLAGAHSIDGAFAEPAGDGSAAAGPGPASLLWDLNTGLPEALDNASLLASSFALQWLEQPVRILNLWCRSLAPGGWLLLAVPTAGSFPQWHRAAEQAGVPCTALGLPDAQSLLHTAAAAGLQLRQGRRLRFSRPRQGGLQTLRHLQRLGASASRRSPLTTGQLRRLLAHWPPASPLTWEVLLLIGQRRT